MSAFENHVCIVTGAGVGIGYEIVAQMVASGAKVLLNDVDADLAQQSAKAINEANHESGGECIGGDVSDVDTVRGLVTQAVKHWGQVNSVVCNAGLTSWGEFYSYTPEDFDRVLAVNLRGSFFLTQAAAQQMREQGSGGRVILMSSVTGHQSIEYITAYAMTKAALEMMARNLVRELSPYGITINAVAPGATITPRNLADDPNYETVWGKVTPTGRPAVTADIANAVLFFLRLESSQITGQSLVVDGGWTSTSQTPSLDFVDTED